MDKHLLLEQYIAKNKQAVAQVVSFNPRHDRLLHFNFTSSNTQLQPAIIANTPAFTQWVTTQLNAQQCRYGIGGYMEHRTLYARSSLFNTTGQAPRSLHLGVDIWGPAGTPVYAPLEGRVHSFQNNDNFGDYGPTIILEHNLDGLALYSLYGHLNTGCLTALQVGQPIAKGQQIAAFGDMNENGSWPPHLHFQLMFDMQGKCGDYPGVCSIDQKEEYAANVPNPAVILQF